MPFIAKFSETSARGFGFTLSVGGGPLVIGDAYQGGYYAGEISTAGNGVADFRLVVAPVSSGQSTLVWKNDTTTTVGADSDIDGPQNTADMVADGNSTVYPAAHFCNNLTIGGYSDWYMPAKNELEICYYNLKPGTDLNNTSSGTNINAVPTRNSNYTTTVPAQTSAANFKTTGAEDFAEAAYWSSTENAYNTAKAQKFIEGFQYNLGKIFSLRTRAVRRVAI
jgi:hypothetical protein